MVRLAAGHLPGLILSIAVVTAACGGDTNADDVVADAAPGSPDAPAGDEPDAALPPDGMTPDPGNCGTLAPDVSSITGTEGLAIGPDGTIYFSQAAGVGRLQPGQAPDKDWAGLGGGAQVWGLALSATHLYVGYPAAGTIERVDLSTGKPDVPAWFRTAGNPNGVIVGADGALYYSDFSGNQVYRIDLATKERTTVVTGARITRPNGLYMVDATHLLVLAYNAADVIELTLRDGVEISRKTVATVDDVGGAALDGITRDAEGRWYLSDNGTGRVIRRPSNFAAPTGDEEVLLDNVPNAANLAFGRGALACTDLYVTSRTAMKVIDIE